MGLVDIACPSCGQIHRWFTGNAFDQRCDRCRSAVPVDRCRYCDATPKAWPACTAEVCPHRMPKAAPLLDKSKATAPLQYYGNVTVNPDAGKVTIKMPKRDAPACPVCGSTPTAEYTCNCDVTWPEPKPAEPAASSRSDVIGALRVIENNAGTLIRWANDPNLQPVRTTQSILKYAREALKSLGCQTSDEEITSKPAADERPAREFWILPPEHSQGGYYVSEYKLLPNMIHVREVKK